MDEHKRTEIVPLNRELYKDLSIDDLEQRLELDCVIFIWCTGGYCEGQGGCSNYCRDYNCPEAL